MKQLSLLLLATFLLLPLFMLAQSHNWALGNLPEKKLQNHKATYHMFNAEGTKVGSMESELIVGKDQITFHDISQFDDGSVYEEATFTFSKAPVTTTKVQIDMTTTNAKLNIDVDFEQHHAKGTYLVNDKTHQIDSTYAYEIVRAELYAFLGSLDYKAEQKFTVKVLAPLSFQTVDAEISVLGDETVTIPLGTFDTIKLFLDGKGVIPSNYVFIDKKSHQVVKYEVTGTMKLDIVLVETH